MKIIDLSGKGAAIDGTENDANLSSLSGINSPITATTHTIDVDDQNDTLEYLNASAIAVTLPTISSVSGSNIHTDDFTVTLKNVGAGLVTITRGGTDTFDDGSTSIDIAQSEYVTIQTDSTLAKWNIINFYDSDYATNTKIASLNTKIIEIGDWDMNADITVSIAHGITQSKIRSINVLIRNDTVSTGIYCFPYYDINATSDEGLLIDGTNIRLFRATLGQFDSTAFDSTSYNRGWITIQYTD